jgi:hypothetical protein
VRAERQRPHPLTDRRFGRHRPEWFYFAIKKPPESRRNDMPMTGLDGNPASVT